MPIHKDIKFSSPEHKALENNNFEFIKNNFHLYEPLKDYWLTAASFYCNLEINQFFIQKGSNPLFAKEENFTNPIAQNNIELVKYYYSLGCFLPGLTEERCGGAICYAVENDNVEMIDYLIKLGCDFHLEYDYAFNRAIGDNRLNSVKYFLSHHKMTFYYNESCSNYNIKNLIENNYCELFDFFMSTFSTPLPFNFNNDLPNLFASGSCEMFDLFFKYGLVKNDSLSLANNFSNLIFSFKKQSKLWKHINVNYPDFIEHFNNNIDLKNISSSLQSLLSQKYLKDKQFNELNENDILLLKEIQPLKYILINTPFIVNALIPYISEGNNFELFKNEFKIEYIYNLEFQNLLAESLEKQKENPIFKELVEIIFVDNFNLDNDYLKKINNFKKLNRELNLNSKIKFNKI